MQPLVEELELTYGDQVLFLQLDANADGEKAFEAGNFPGHPSFVIVQPDGTEAWRMFGVVPYSEMVHAIEDVVR